MNKVDWLYDDTNEHLYGSYELDYDDTYYFKVYEDVEKFPFNCMKIDGINNKINIIDNENPSIVGNALFFAMGEKKYYINISSSLDEEKYINKIIFLLEHSFGFYDFYYKRGRID